MQNRKKWQRPQAIILSNNPGTLLETQVGIDNQGSPVYTYNYYPEGEEFTDFIILSDHNRGQITFRPERIETKKRMVNGRMRSYFIADKLNISTSWTNLPSRAFSNDPAFDTSGVPQGITNGEMYTVDGGAGGVDLLEWHENNPGSFWAFLSYDKYSNFTAGSEYNNLDKYSQVVEVFFSSFEYTVVKRGGSNHDLWDVSLALEEV